MPDEPSEITLGFLKGMREDSRAARRVEMMPSPGYMFVTPNPEQPIQGTIGGSCLSIDRCPV